MGFRAENFAEKLCTADGEWWVHPHTNRYSTYITVQYSRIHYNRIKYSRIQYSRIQYTIQYTI